MITVYCGDNSRESRRLFAQERMRKQQAGYMCTTLTEVSVANLRDALQHDATLFQERQLLFLENCLSKKAIRDMLLSALEVECCIWEEKLTGKEIKPLLPGGVIKECPLSHTIWRLLDSLVPGRVSIILPLFRDVVHSDGEDIVLYMLIQRAKELILVVHGLSGKLKRADWQLRRLEIQAQSWNEERLRKLHRKLCEIEITVKSGQTPYSLSQALDILFCFYLQ